MTAFCAALHPDGTVGELQLPPDASPAQELPQGALDGVLRTYRAIQASESDGEAVFRLTVDNAQALLGADLSCVWRPDALAVRGGQVVASVGNRVERWAAELGPAETGAGALCVDLAGPVACSDYPAYVAGAGAPVTRHLAFVEGIASLLCLPLRESAADRAAGVLYIGRRDRSTFDPIDVQLASALAGQAALALQNGRLRRELEEQRQLVEHAWSVTGRLEATAEEGGVEAVRRQLEREIGRRVDLVLEAEDAGTSVDVVPVVAGRMRYGALHVHGRPLNAHDAVTVERATSFVARELARQRAMDQAQLRSGAQLLRSLLEGADRGQAHVVERAGRIGFDLDRPVTVLAISDGASAPADRHALVTGKGGVAEADVLAVEQGDCDLLAVAMPSGWSPDDALTALLSGAPSGRIGLSAPRADVATAGEEAVGCLRLARAARTRRVVCADDLGALGFVLGADDPVGRLQAQTSSALAPLWSAAPRARAPLVATLDAYLRSGRRLAETADRLGVHPNTVKYRLTRLGDLVGPLDGPHGFQLWLALRAAEVLELLGLSPAGGGQAV